MPVQLPLGSSIRESCQRFCVVLGHYIAAGYGQAIPRPLVFGLRLASLNVQVHSLSSSTVHPIKVRVSFV